MSGFAGIVRFDGSSALPRDLAALAAGLEACGIGRARTWRGGSAGLVFRPRIFTPQDLRDRQPLETADGGALLFDGRLDAREDLAPALGRRFDPDLPDSAWVAAAIERWGCAAPARLIGDFALAWWDEAGQRLLLARDRVGQRSLYYHRGKGFLAFATTLRALLALPEVPRALDDLGLADFITLNPFNATGTIYRDIQRIEPAHATVFDRDAARSERYWSLDAVPAIRLPRDSDYVEAARDLLDRAVACRLRTPDPIVSMTSGGLDSAGVTATASRLAAPEPVYGLTAVPSETFAGPVPDGSYGDERPYVAALGAHHPNLVIETLSLSGPEAIEQDARALFAVSAQPLRNVHGVAWLGPVFRRAAALGATTLLVGDFGNMSLSYDGSGLLDDMRAQRRWLALARTVWTTERSHGRSPWRPLARHFVPQQWQPRTDPSEDAGYARYSAINPAFAGAIGLDRHFAAVGFEPGRRRLTGGYPARLRRMLEGSAIASDGRAALRAIHGLDLRDPLADSRLIEFCSAIPADQFLRDGQTRWLARRVLADRLPPEIVENRRRGAQCTQWFERLDQRSDRIADDIARLANSPIASRVLDVPRLQALAANWPVDSAAAQRQSNDYRFVLARGAHVGEFVRWVEGANA